ncbi:MULTISPECIES: DUF2019 domain-containing protein [Phyllobacteriaceae]|jgi:Domain of unknown function (DUF2019)|uniref:Uncharacterized protein n=1 Tax=Mesorhizobium hungaricum TaxID=1566387 RepID=A0A1C2DIY0_9HYPH|nr:MULTISPECIES: DUF2019 domain-containing protein [Mesorhizobium]MBN9233098.1 DUF2019 domain-containing protein [Mesorhizobium sp.]MDQ0332216.1 hypothetical protein [Mesorhizobium sp. YL-MeA3-2017]OCX14721.1 hypothetical protein QV13_20035 [Mesorhizobium hungaricum]
MASPVTDARITTLVSRLIEANELEIAAREREDTRAGNRQVDRMRLVLDELVNSPIGRDTLERLMTHEMPEVRLRAAGRVMGWAPKKAIPVLGSLVANWMPKDPKKGYVAVGLSAGWKLYEYFGVKDFDHNKLIEPLRTYGIELPRRPD